MDRYTLYIEIYAKKMRVSLEADSAKEAREKVRQAIIFHKIERKPEMPDILKDIFAAFGGKI
ncbi:MAG: hypothetical protein WC332_00715 [Clostridia bacterium]|jgi:hypothetical protein